MKYITCEVPEQCAYLIPIGDLHCGDSAFIQNVNKVKGYIKWVRETKNARVLLGGDLFNCATRQSKTSPFDRQTGVIEKDFYNDEFEMVYRLFEPIKDKIVAAISGNHECFDESTEVLTESGWNKWNEINKDTVLLTYNNEKDLIEREKPIAIQSYNHNGYLNRIIGKSVDLLVTDEHRILFKSGTNGKKKTLPLKDIHVGDNRITLTSSGTENNKEYNIKDDELKILAWFYTDGCLRKKQITFYQRESKYKKITETLDRLGWKYIVYKRDRNIKQICGKILKKKCEISVEIRLVSPDNHRLVELSNNNKKDLPEFIYKLSDRQFDVFLNSFIDGDGSRHKSAPETSLMVYGVYNIIEQLQRACFLHGYRTSISEYRGGDFRLNITKNKYFCLDRFKNHISKEKYKGVIWDVTTPNDTVIVRRNGKISITGNSRLQDFANIDLTAHLCFRLGVPYMGYSGVIAFRVGKYKNGYRQYYTVYAHHTTGGGATLGSKLNRVVKLSEIVEGCDVYCGFHGHGKVTGIENVYYPSPEAKAIKCRKRLYVSCGSYLEWIDSYAEQKMLRPASLGSPRIRMDGRKEKHDAHISF